MTDIFAIPTCTIHEAQVWTDAHWLDVRSSAEWAAGHIAGAQHLPLEQLHERRAELPSDPATRIVCYCAVGQRSARAVALLREAGFSNVWSLADGFAAWQAAGQPWERGTCALPATEDRYARHLALPEVGAVGQARLRAAHIVLIGAGGLGCPAAQYLTMAGIGTLTLIDDDCVALSNLQRQGLYSAAMIGELKVACAQRTLAALNSDVTILPIAERVTMNNVDVLLAEADVVIDGSDNFPTRYMLNDACVRLRKPLIHGSVQRFSGQVSVLCASGAVIASAARQSPECNDVPCYRCLYPLAPPPDLAPNCAEAGVLGVLPGMIGTLQATEALKLILQIGEPLAGRLLCIDALTMQMRTLTIERDPQCSCVTRR